jgi:3',5'-cyclic AMP phosphodiesterase CpdA
MDPFTLRILHLSDLHERGAREGEPWRRRRVLGSAWEANLDALCEGGSPQLVCFTGDIADWGQKTEYGQAGEFLHALMERLGLPMDRLFLVPGNHDIQRKVAEAPWKRLRRDLPRADRQAVSRWLAGGNAPLGFKDRQRDQLLERQAAYRRWVADDLGLPHLAGGGGAHPHLGWRQTLRLPGEPGADDAPRPFDLHLIGLDSAWLAGDDSDAGHLRLTDDQVMRQVTDDQGNPLAGLRIALVHHPLDDLADGAECRRLLADHVDLLLRGHLHQSEPNEWADPERRLRQVAAGCLYEGHGADQYPNACTLVEIGVDADGRPQRYQLRFRGWSSRGHWYDDNSLYPGTKDGRLVWWMRSPAVAPELHPKVERLFVGREQELQQLEAALLPVRGHSRPVAVCGVQGMPGVGKSYLVDRFYVLHKDRFAGGYQRITLNPDLPLDASALLDQLTERVELPAGLPDRDVQLAGALARGPTLAHIENVDSEAAAVIAVDLVERLRGAPLALSGRLQGLGQDAGRARVPLRPFDPANALEQLRQELGGEATLDDSHRELVGALGWLPLAIHLAAGHLRPPRGRTAAGFLAKLRSRGLNLAPVDIADHGLRTDRARAILSATFDLSLELLTERYLTAFRYLGHAPVGGFGDSLGATLSGLDPDEFEDLCFEAAGLSLLDGERSTGGPSGNAQRRWRIHPLLAEYLRQGSADGAEADSRIGAWFMNRLPEGGDWNAVHAESDALIDWLRRAPRQLWVGIERAGSRYAMRNGPFHAWAVFCETALAEDLEDRERSNMLWTLGNVTQSSGQPDRAMTVVREKADLDRTRGEEREVALAMGKVADILQARGELDEALRIRREVELPVYEKLGDVRSLLVGRANLAIAYLQRGQRDDRRHANKLLCLALNDARRLRIPEAQVIEGILSQAGLDCG